MLDDHNTCAFAHKVNSYGADVRIGVGVILKDGRGRKKASSNRIEVSGI